MFNLMTDREFVQAEKMCLLVEDISMVANALQCKVVFGTQPYNPAPDVCDCYVEIYPPSMDKAVIEALEALGIDFGGEGMGCSYTGPEYSTYIFTWPIGYHPLRDGHMVVLGPEGGSWRATLNRDTTIKLTDLTIPEAEFVSQQTKINVHDRYYHNIFGRGSMFDVRDITPTIDNPGGKSRCWGGGAPTAKGAAEKRRRSDTHVNGRPKKGWQR